MRIFTKVRLSDVLDKGRTFLTAREFDFYTRSHFDFVVADGVSKPLMVVEYDGPLHSDPKQRERDRIKYDLCRRADLGILRINDKYVTKLFRGITLLRWVIEVYELRNSFHAAQKAGVIPADESFDPAFVQPGGNKRRFPYWLSKPAINSFHKLFATLDPTLPKGWHGIVGEDENGNSRRLSCLYFGDQVLWSKTGIRCQGLDFPADDLLDQLDSCELGMCLQKFQNKELLSTAITEFRPIFWDFCDRYHAHPGVSVGDFPFNVGWSFQNGWTQRS